MIVRRTFAGLLVCAVALVGAGSALASASGIVISEFRFRGPTGGNDEFVELLNTSAAPVAVGNWALQGCSSTTGAPTNRATIPTGTSIPAGGHYLFTHTGFSGTVTGDRTYGVGISDNAGARIVTDTGMYVDGVGAAGGPAVTCREGAGLAIPTTNGENAFERKDGGRQDTDDNASDFIGPKAADPQAASAPPAPVDVAIHTVQGAGHLSTFSGTPVRVNGIVTARRGNGFWVQDAAPDADDATSEGIFVFGSAAASMVAAGDAARVTGTVTEFRGAADNLSVTELTGASVEILSSGNPLPAATVIGAGGRVPPAEVIEDDATGDVETSGNFDPAQDGIDFYESLEGMLVQVNDAVAVGPRNQFGEIAVVGDNGANASVLTARGGIVIRPNDFNPERIILDDEILRPLSSTPVVDVADRFPGALVGALDYSFDNFKLQVSTVPAPVDGALARETTAAPRDQEIAVATFNVENLDPSDGATIDRLAALIVNNLAAPDLLGIEEVQDNDGAANTAVTDASASWNALIAAIQAAGGPLYEFRQIDPVDDQDGGQPGGNIRVGFLFRTDRGLSFVDRAGGGPTVDTTVIDHPSGPRLSSSPGRIDPANPSFVDTRKSLVGEFKGRGKTLFVVVNHFSSKGDDQPLFGRFQPPTRFSEGPRHGQAQAVNDFVDEILAADRNANVIVLGDINDFDFSETISILEGGVLTTLMDTLPLEERYSYVFEGNSQVLDQILLSNGMLTRFPFAYDVVHVNSEFADQASDHEPQVARLDLTGRP
ncbi:MAG: endonuclease/exonuclease/phosphatase family protein [Gaiellaceae bacterium]